MKHVNAPTPVPCSGCGVCAAVCPKGAIRLEADDAGFFVARVEETRCVDCGLCQKVCARFTPPSGGVDLRTLPHYALQSTDDATVRTCSSGGIAHELALSTLEQGGTAVGVTYDVADDRARHVLVNRKEDLPRIDGSKYLQSDSSAAFEAVIRTLRENAEARFTVFGTPCQIAGLDMAGRQYGVRDRLLLVELFCHGVPSYALWDEQCRRIRKKLGATKFDDVQFRYKKDDWHSYCLRVTAGDHTYYGSREGTLFFQTFFENVLLGDGCYGCQLRKERSFADIRLGDYWGSTFLHRSDGVSAVFACTEAGQAALRALEPRLVRLEPAETAVMLSAQNMEGYRQPELHDVAMRVLRERGIVAAVKAYRAKLPAKQKLKRRLLSVSAALPDGLRAKLRKVGK